MGGETNAPATPSLASQLTHTLLGLLAIPSVTGAETRLADAFWQWGHGVGVWPEGKRRRFGNAMVLGEPSGARPALALVGHLDTVPPPSEGFALPQLREREQQIDIVGLGASDMKAGLAVMQVLTMRHAQRALPLELLLVLYDKEEGPFADNGLEPVLQQCPFLREVDLAVVMEPTSNWLELGCMGGLQARVQVQGQAAHSARPWQGVNAIHRAAPFLQALAERGVEDVDIDGLVFRNVLSATMARGGRARNVVPDHFEINVNARFAPRAGAVDAAKAELTRLAEGHHVVVDDISPPGPVPQNNALLDHFRHLCELRVRPKQAWTDVARLAAHGIDAVNFGPGDGAQAHQVGEYVTQQALLDSYEALAKLLTTPYSP